MPGIPSPEIPEAVLALMRINPVSDRIRAFDRIVAGNPSIEKYRDAVCRGLPDV